MIEIEVQAARRTSKGEVAEAAVIRGSPKLVSGRGTMTGPEVLPGLPTYQAENQ
jgi:hypothetical protein